MEVYIKSVALYSFVGLALLWVSRAIYRFLEWSWFKPKRIEKRLREQGLKGNPYRFLKGDQYDSAKLLQEAQSKPIAMEEDVKKRIIPQILKTVETHGKNSFMWAGNLPSLIITEPDMVKEVLTKYNIFQKNLHDLDPITEYLLTGVGILEGDEWFKRRKLIKAAFRFEKLKSMLPTFYSCCRDVVSKWESRVDSQGGSAEVDVWVDLRILAGDVISRSLFGINYEHGMRIFDLLNELVVLTIQVIRSVYFPGKSYLPLKINNRIRAIDREVRSIIIDTINRKKKEMEAGVDSGDDFIRRLLEYNMNNKDEALSNDEIVNECKLVYFAGQDTTASLLVWSMVFMSYYQEWQARAREEVFQVFGDRTPDYDGISNLKIVTMIVNEVLRLYPSLVEVTKVSTEDTQLGKYKIPAGVHLIMPQVMIHYDKEIWGEDAMEFKPERFSEGLMNATKIPGSYFPFSLGPRMCIGQNLVLLEAKMAMALILRRFRFELSPSYVHAPILVMGMKPQHGAHLILHKI